MKVQFGKPNFSGNPLPKIREVLENGLVRQGYFVKKYQDKLSELYNVKAVATSSCTNSLFALLHYINVRDKYVILPSYTHASSFISIIMAGGKPILVDCDSESGLISCDSVIEAIDLFKDVAAILVVHMFGMAADMLKISAVAEEYKIAIIEDCAYALGSKYEGKHVGTFGVGGALSHGILKPICCGEGGTIITKHESVVEYSKAFINYGFTTHNETMGEIGLNLKMSEISAILLGEQLDNYERLINYKRILYNIYKESFAEYNINLIPESSISKSQYNFCSLPILIPKNLLVESFMQHMNERHVQCQRIVPIQHFKSIKERSKHVSLNRSEYFYKNVVVLPFHNSISEDEILYVCENVISFFNANY